ncbi:MAG: GntR family transcriptional regulator [Bacilli bacterium]
MAEESLWYPDVRIDPSRPLYEQFCEQMRADIARGVLQSGARLPSVRDLAAWLRVNPNTVMRTYQELERSKLLVTRRGQGTFVTDDVRIVEESKREIARQAVTELRARAAAIGLTTEQLWLLGQGEEQA